MKRRVALVSSCTPPLPGVPATGGGLRTAQLLETLRGAGHSVHAEQAPELQPHRCAHELQDPSSFLWLAHHHSQPPCRRRDDPN